MRRKRVVLSLILPVYNSLLLLRRNLPKVHVFLRRLLGPSEFEIVICEDGSTDGTAEEAARLSRKYGGSVIHLHSDKRLGRGGALKNAVGASSGEIIGYMDIDLSTDMVHLREAVDKIMKEGYDCAMGSRLSSGSRTSRSLERELASRSFNFLVRLLLGSRLKDHQCGFKFFRREFIKRYANRAVDNHWFWDTEISLLAQRDGRRIAEIPVNWRESKDTTVRLWNDTLYMSRSILRQLSGR